MRDPLIPPEHRYPRALISLPPSAEPPSQVRPFVMLGGVVTDPGQAKHRTNPYQTVITQPTQVDGKNSGTKTDKFTQPDT
jgi:hypothetical protein